MHDGKGSMTKRLKVYYVLSNCLLNGVLVWQSENTSPAWEFNLKSK